MVARPIGDAHAFSANGASATMGTSIVHGQTMLLQLLFAACVFSELFTPGLVSSVGCRFIGRERRSTGSICSPRRARPRLRGRHLSLLQIFFSLARAFGKHCQ